MKVVAGDQTGSIELPPQPPGPGLHALIIGVGSYPNLSTPPNDTLGMRHLDGPARTALRLAEFLTSFDGTKGKLAVPLRSLRVLISPSPNEVVRNLKLPDGLPRASDNSIREAARRWRNDAASSVENVALFYFAGHGIQRGPAEGVLLPEDVLEGYPESPILDRAFDVNNLYNGMAPRPGAGGAAPEPMAQTQYYFFDACRAPLEALAKFADAAPRKLFNVRADGVDERIAPRFFAAAPGDVGYALPSGTTFGEDLLLCFGGAGADLVRRNGNSVWGVTIDRLARALEILKDNWNRERPAFKRSFEVGNITSTKPILLALKNPPTVKCRFTVVPDAACGFARIRVVELQGGAEVIVYKADCPFASPAHDFDLPGGKYIVRGCKDAIVEIEDIAFVVPPVFEHDVVFP